MIQLCYISTARPSVTMPVVDDILAVSRRNNARRRVTGLLLFNGKRFLQILEGMPQEVEQAYARILKDDRHFALVKLSERTIEEREFGDWDMAFERFVGDRAQMEKHVSAMTRTASANVRALFTSYAAV